MKKRFLNFAQKAFDLTFYTLLGLMLFGLLQGQFHVADWMNAQANISASSTIWSTQSSALSQKDQEHYAHIITLQSKGEWSQADAIISQLENPILMGYVLAQRYLHENYISKPQELTSWLRDYADHYEADRIYALARKKGLHIDPPAHNARKSFIKTMGESFQNLRHYDPASASGWKNALNSWKHENYADAFEKFAAIAMKAEHFKPWDQAAIFFWTYRAASKLEKHDLARAYLERAAEFPRSFYGIQALSLLGKPIESTLKLDAQTVIEQLLSDNQQLNITVSRLDALIQIGAKDIAKDAMIYHYKRAEAEERMVLAALAEKLDDPALQLRMGVDLRKKGKLAGYALYPIPPYEVQLQPALTYAVARQESGFKDHLTSSAGAKGVMQIMPETARYIAKTLQWDRSTSLSDAEYNFALGQHYLSYLSEKPYIKGNMALLLAGYNAGPGVAKRWSERVDAQTDPLYFIETLPYRETRDYVMNVMASYWVYEARLGERSSASPALLAQGAWPMLPFTTQLADNAELPWLSDSPL